jgi:hypothetical protein
MKYRKKPVVIDAFKYEGDLKKIRRRILRS